MEFIFLLIALSGLIFFRLKNLVWIPVSFIILLLFTIDSDASTVTLSFLWLVYFAIIALTQIPWLRQFFITRPVFYYLKKVLPKISETEKAAIKAGDIWWDGELFQGNPNWQQLFDVPVLNLTDEEQAFVEQEVNELCAMLDDWKIYCDRDLPKRVWRFLKDKRFFSLVIDKKYGGLGFSATAHSTIITKIATRSPSVAVTVMVPNSLGPAELIAHYGTQEQKNYYLPRLASGEEIPCFALTALEAGSDAAAMKDNGIVCRDRYDGQETIGIRLNWSKRYITLAPIATVMALAVKLYDPEHLLGENENIGITLCLVPTKLHGVSATKRHNPMNMAFLNGPIYGKDVFVPLDAVIGGKKMCGQGWRMMMESLSAGRGISLPALGVANTQLAFLASGAYARLREQFHLPIGHFEGIQAILAEIGGFNYLCESVRWLTIAGIDQNIKPAIITAITKYHVTELARKVTAHAMDIHGGRTIQLGPKNYLAMAHMASPISITVEGANILTRNLIIFGQGAMRCHPYLLDEIEASQSKDFKKFDKLFPKHLGYTLSNGVRSFVYGLTGGHLIFTKWPGLIGRYQKQLTRMSAALAFISDIAMVLLGGKLKRKESLSARLGDVLSYLYLASSVLKYFQDNKRPDTDAVFVRWTLDYCLHKIYLAFSNFFSNFTARWLGHFLRFIIFPLGQSYHIPKDKLGIEIAKVMQEPSALRDRLTKNCYVAKDDSAIAKLEKAFHALVDTQAIRNKLRDALRSGELKRIDDVGEQLKLAEYAGVLSSKEIAVLLEVEALRRAALEVDEF